MHMILTGATGLVGSAVLDAMLKTKSISKISILSRRAVPMVTGETRANVIIHEDFAKYEPELLEKLRGASGVVWALGISQTKTSKEEYTKITKDWPLAAAEAFAALPPDGEPFRFVYVSGGGATQNPTPFSALYSRVKGETEISLSKMRTSQLLTESVRPCAVDPAGHSEILPHIPDPGRLYRWSGIIFYPLVRTVIQWLHSPTEVLGRFLVGMAMGRYDGELDKGANGITKLDGGLRVVENWAFRRLSGLS